MFFLTEIKAVLDVLKTSFLAIFLTGSHRPLSGLLVRVFSAIFFSSLKMTPDCVQVMVTCEKGHRLCIYYPFILSWRGRSADYDAHLSGSLTHAIRNRSPEFLLLMILFRGDIAVISVSRSLCTANRFDGDSPMVNYPTQPPHHSCFVELNHFTQWSIEPFVE